MANSILPEGLTNQVSSESLDTFLNNLPTPIDLEDMAMDQLICDSSNNNNVKQSATMTPSSTTASIQNESEQDINATETSCQVVHTAMTGLDDDAGGSKNSSANKQPQHLATSNNPPPPQHRQRPNGAAITTVALSATPIVSGAVPEFLYQLFKMLTDNNREVIEWADGKIKVHSPFRLQNEILHHYFRHSKFASFQRQLNYFGFRKLAGKGKMSPCSYVNDTIGDDLNRIMLIKRKSGPAGANDGRKNRKVLPALAGAAAAASPPPANAAAPSKAVQTGRIRRRSARTNQGTAMPLPPSLSDKVPASVLARQAVGKGVRHNVTSSATSMIIGSSVTALQRPTTNSSTMLAPEAISSIDQSLSELANNYHSSLATTAATTSTSTTANQQDTSFNHDFLGGFLSRNSSLVDLAMIPPVDGSYGDYPLGGETFDFVDFPNPEVDPLSCLNSDNDEEEGNG